MKKFYEKNELGFSLFWIALYVVLFSVSDNISYSIGTAKILTAPLCVLMTVFLAVWIFRNNLQEKYGLCKVKINFRDYLYFAPLLVIASINLWGGITLRLSVLETVLHIVSMLCVGFLEEVIFRGFLFKALCSENIKSAVLVSSITFGIGHIVNLLNGAEVLSTLLQICYAVAVGFLFTILFYKSGSLLPCIITHSAVNSLSAFACDRSEMFGIITAVILTLVSLAYAFWIIHRMGNRGSK